MSEQYQVMTPCKEVSDILLNLFKKAGYNILQVQFESYYPAIVIRSKPKTISGNYVLTDNYTTISLEKAFEIAQGPQVTEVGGHEVQFVNGKIIIGCKTFLNETLKELIRRMEHPLMSTDGRNISILTKENQACLEGSNIRVPLNKLREIAKQIK